MILGRNLRDVTYGLCLDRPVQHCKICHRIVNRRDETVALASECLDEAWRFGRVTQRRPESLDGGVEAVLEIHERLGWPEPLLQLLTIDYFAGTLDECCQQFDRLAI